MAMPVEPESCIAEAHEENFEKASIGPDMQWCCDDAEVAIVAWTFEGVSFDGEDNVGKIWEIIRNRLQAPHIKDEEDDDDKIQDPKVRTLRIDDVLCTHDCVSKEFRDGKTFDQLVHELDEGQLNPLTATFLKLDVFYWPDRAYYSLCNRRTMCLKRHQQNRRQIDPSYRVQCRARVFQLPQNFVRLMELNPMYEKFVRSYTTRDRGQSVKVRGRNGNIEVCWWPTPFEQTSQEQQNKEQKLVRWQPNDWYEMQVDGFKFWQSVDEPETRYFWGQVFRLQSRGNWRGEYGQQIEWTESGCSPVVQMHVPNLGNHVDGTALLAQFRERLGALGVTIHSPILMQREPQEEDALTQINSEDIIEEGQAYSQWFLKSVNLAGPFEVLRGLEKGTPALKLHDEYGIDWEIKLVKPQARRDNRKQKNRAKYVKVMRKALPPLSNCPSLENVQSFSPKNVCSTNFEVAARLDTSVTVSLRREKRLGDHAIRAGVLQASRARSSAARTNSKRSLSSTASICGGPSISTPQASSSKRFRRALLA